MQIIKYTITAIICLLIQAQADAQLLRGVVYDGGSAEKIPLAGASVIWQGTRAGTVANEKGRFQLAKPDSLPATLVVSFIGYLPSTIIINQQDSIEVSLEQQLVLKEAVVKGNKDTGYRSKYKVYNSEIISEKELHKAACCNLSESFENSASVEVSYSDAVSGAKQIRLLGLDGIYTQMLMENMPFLRGLSSTYGISQVPGAWIESIQVTKGTGSVVNGYESMAGQINLEFQKPFKGDKNFLNIYADDNGNTEANYIGKRKLNDHWATGLFLHGNYSPFSIDQNKDGFLDQPRTSSFNIMSRWNYDNANDREMQIGANAMVENRSGGQMSYDQHKAKESQSAYGIGIDTRHLDLFLKRGFLYTNKPYQSIGLIVKASQHESSAFYGNNEYSGTQTSFYGNFIFQSIIATTDHKFKTGASFSADQFNESFADTAKDTLMKRFEVVPGIFGEYTFSYAERLTAVAGFRADYHSWERLVFTPRLHVKYSLTPDLSLRLSGGSGFRVANVWVENAAVFASSRKIIFEEKPLPERAWNYGASLMHDFSIKKKKGYINLEYFRTDFISQVVADIDRNPGAVYFYNLKGRSYSNALQAEISITPIKNLDVRTAYKWYDVQVTYNGKLMEKPFVPKSRFLFNVAYMTRLKQWNFDATALWYGASRLPATDLNPEQYRRGNQSPAYWIFHAQVTKNFKKWAVYAGSENILDYKQPNPIVSADNPFGSYFDASMIWGPITGRRIYAGLRWKF